MPQPYVGEIRMFAGNFAPAGWMFCEGQLLPIAEHEAVFALIGTTYGGDGQSTFALPDFRGRIPTHKGNGMVVGGTGGAEQVTLTAPQLAAHNHKLMATLSQATSTVPQNNVLAAGMTGLLPYAPGKPTGALSPESLTPVAGGTAPHTNVQPYLCVHYIIATGGLYPSPS